MTKYIDAEKLIALLEQRKKQLVQWTDKEYANQRIDEIDCILDVDIDSLQQERPSLPDNLDEAANKFAVLYDQGTCDGIAQECFKAGAQWMENQFEHCGTFPVEDPRGGYWPTDCYIKKK